MSGEQPFTHLTASGDVHMVDVSAKEVTTREAVATAGVHLGTAVREALFSGDLPKGDALAAVRLAGITGAKRTSELIPLCHSLPIDAIKIEVEPTDEGAKITATVVTTGRTGVEMEALTAVSVAALTFYNMVKGLDRGAVIGPIQLIRKSGGRSGTWER